MHIGMLWFDNSQTAFPVKLQKAIDYFKKKYGREPDLCLVHPSMLEDQKKRRIEVCNILVRPYRPVLPGHIWIGVEDHEEKDHAQQTNPSRDNGSRNKTKRTAKKKGGG